MKERLRNIREERHARTEKNNAARKKVIENLEQQNLFLPSDYTAWINRYRSLSKKVDVITVNFPFLNLFFFLLIGVMGSVAFLAFLKLQSLFENFTTPLVILMVTPVAMVFVYYIVLSIMRCVSSIVKCKYQEEVDVMRCHAYCAVSEFLDKGRSNGWSFNLSNAIECEQIQNYIDSGICPNAQIVPVGNRNDPTNGMDKRFILCPEIENLEIVIEKVLSKQG